MEWFILSNMAKGHAMQVNDPIGKDIWEEMAQLITKDSMTEADAVSIDYLHTFEDTMALMRFRDELRRTGGNTSRVTSSSKNRAGFQKGNLEIGTLSAT
jgi:hypothetical protein